MTHVAAETRQFSVHARHLDCHHARGLEEASFEAAAVAPGRAAPPPGSAPLGRLPRLAEQGHRPMVGPATAPPGERRL